VLHLSVYILPMAVVWSLATSPTKTSAGSTIYDRDDTILDLKAHIGFLSQRLSECGCQTEQTDMKLRYIRNVEVTCNDRSKAGYHIRKSLGSRRWVIYLEGTRHMQLNQHNSFSRDTQDSTSTKASVTRH
jgi:hypothetical protein